MANNRFVLDTSAIFTLIEDEEGASRVEQILKKGDEVAMRRYAMIKQIDATIIWNADEPTLLTAAQLKASRRLSFADSIIAATAIQHNAILLHKEPEYEPLQGVVDMEILPYKK